MEYDLKGWRHSLGLTQEAAATLLGVHRVTYTRWETEAQEAPKLIGLACLSIKQMMQPKMQKLGLYPGDTEENMQN